MATEQPRSHWAHCDECNEFETRSTAEQAQRWLDLHRAFTHTQPSCHRPGCHHR